MEKSWPRPFGSHIEGGRVCRAMTPVLVPLRCDLHPAGVCFLFFSFSHSSHLFVFVFHLWMEKLFLHVLCILKQIFNYTCSTVLMRTYEQLLKVQINAPRFQLFVTIFAFCQNIPGMWSPTSTFCRLFWNFCQWHGQCCESWEREGLQLVTVLFGWVDSGVCCDLPGQAERENGGGIGLR